MLPLRYVYNYTYRSVTRIYYANSQPIVHDHRKGRRCRVSNGIPLRASVIVTDTNLGTSTDDTSYFSIRIDTTRHQTLGIQYIGFKSKRIELTSKLLQTGWFAGFNSRYVSRQDRVATGEDETDGYFLLNLEGGIRMSADRRHNITFRIENALNTSYRDHLTRIEDRNKPMPGRGVTVTYRYMF